MKTAIQPFPLRRFALLTLVTLGIAAAQPAPAADSQVRWLCWYDGESGILCQADRNPQGGMAMTNPYALGDTISIPLFTPAEDMDRVRELAQAVMCGARPGCSVAFGESQAVLASLSLESAIELADQYDESLRD